MNEPTMKSMARLPRLVCSLWVLVAIVMLHTLGNAADFSPKSHFYRVDYLRQQHGGVPVINIIFSAPVSSDLAEKFLRQEINRAVNYAAPWAEILAYAWVRSSPNAIAEDNVKLGDGSSFLVYSPKTKRILTEKEYNLARRPKAERGKAINVSIDLHLERNPIGKVRVAGRTNLPDGMRLMIGLRNTAIAYFAQDKVSVISGAFKSSWFSNRGRALPPGTYGVEVSSPIADLQPDSVKRIIGKNGQNLSGNMIVTSFGSNRIYLTLKKRVH